MSASMAASSPTPTSAGQLRASSCPTALLAHQRHALVHLVLQVAVAQHGLHRNRPGLLLSKGDVCRRRHLSWAPYPIQASVASTFAEPACTACAKWTWTGANLSMLSVLERLYVPWFG